MFWKNLFTNLHYGSGIIIGTFSLKYFVEEIRKEQVREAKKTNSYIQYKR